MAEFKKSEIKEQNPDQKTSYLDQIEAEKLYDLAESYRKGTDVKRDFKKAFELYTQAAELGNINSIQYLVGCYVRGFKIEKDEKKALDLCVKAADLGDSDPIACLGRWYETGYKIERNRDKAIEVYEIGAKYDNIDAIHGLAYRLAFKREHYEAFQVYFKKAQNIDHPIINFCLGHYYEKGRGTEKDLKMAQVFYTKAADAGHRVAISRLKKQPFLL